MLQKCGIRNVSKSGYVLFESPDIRHIRIILVVETLPGASA